MYHPFDNERRIDLSSVLGVGAGRHEKITRERGGTGVGERRPQGALNRTAGAGPQGNQGCWGSVGVGTRAGRGWVGGRHPILTPQSPPNQTGPAAVWTKVTATLALPWSPWS